MSTKPPADPPMERSVNPVRPATAPAPRKPAVPPRKSGFQRFVLQFLLLVIALGGAFGTGYLVNANEMQLDRNDRLQQLLDAEQRILALEQQIAELQERRESGNRVELDLTEVFEPIREAVGRIALARMGEISREITTELTRLVEDDLTSIDDPANATGTLTPDGTSGPATDQMPEPEAASAGDEGAMPESGAPENVALDAAAATGRPDAIELVGAEPEGDPQPDESQAAGAIEPPAPAGEAATQEASRSEAPGPAAGELGIELADDPAQPEPTEVAELTGPQHPSGSPGRSPVAER